MNTVNLNISLAQVILASLHTTAISHIFPISYNPKKHLYSKAGIPEELSYCRLSGAGALRHNPARNWLFLSWTRVSIFLYCFVWVGGGKGCPSGGGGVWETPKVSFSLTASQWEMKGFPVGGGGVCVWVGGYQKPTRTDWKWNEESIHRGRGRGRRQVGGQLERNQHWSC